jgi:hypothetical protein
MKITPLIKISTIKQGSVYYFLQTHFQSPNPHYYVVLNKDPLGSTALIVVNATSKVETGEKYVNSRKLPPETFVKVEVKECPFLKMQSAFNCNSVGIYTPQKLIELVNSNTFEYKGEIGITVLEKLKKGVLASPLVSNEHKVLI